MLGHQRQHDQCGHRALSTQQTVGQLEQRIRPHGQAPVELPPEPRQVPQRTGQPVSCTLFIEALALRPVLSQDKSSDKGFTHDQPGRLTPTAKPASGVGPGYAGAHTLNHKLRPPLGGEELRAEWNRKPAGRACRGPRGVLVSHREPAGLTHPAPGPAVASVTLPRTGRFLGRRNPCYFPHAQRTGIHHLWAAPPDAAVCGDTTDGLSKRLAG
jgi:hypothetical protein